MHGDRCDICKLVNMPKEWEMDWCHECALDEGKLPDIKQRKPRGKQPPLPELFPGPDPDSDEDKGNDQQGGGSAVAATRNRSLGNLHHLSQTGT